MTFVVYVSLTHAPIGILIGEEQVILNFVVASRAALISLLINVWFRINMRSFQVMSKT